MASGPPGPNRYKATMAFCTAINLISTISVRIPSVHATRCNHIQVTPQLRKECFHLAFRPNPLHLQMSATLIQAADTSINPYPLPSPSPQPITTDLSMHLTPQELPQLGDQGHWDCLDRSRRINAEIPTLIALSQPDTRMITPQRPEGKGTDTKKSSLSDGSYVVSGSGNTNTVDGDPGQAAER
ncbi:hypothetical protein HOY82DRAFT_535432 [Tuber indicum]|nr:hypothetical protein HOY82DRAFT_535432 [Tuber indicum]